MKKLVKESLNESSYKDELINDLLNTVYSTDDPKYDARNERYLNTLTIDELESKLDVWNRTSEDDDLN